MMPYRERLFREADAKLKECELELPQFRGRLWAYRL